jgi:molecular chaperone GrpE
MSKRDKEMSQPVDDDREDAADVEPETGGEDEEAGDSRIEVEIKSDDDTIPGEDEEDLSAGVSKETAEKEAEVESERFLRLAAEFDNYKKRTAREFEDIIKRANVRLLRELVDIVDNFERALSVEAEDQTHQAYRQGVELIYNQLSGLLNKEGVTPIEAVGKPFDPHYHEAVMQTESEEYDEGVVAQEIQKGYRIGDKVLRHSRVVVSRGKSTGEDEKEQTDE